MGWYIGCTSAELQDGTLSRTLLDTPIALFRGADRKPAALLDRCAHRNIPLSEGRVVDGCVQCRYHGWRYDPAGRCVKIPGLSADAMRENRSVPRFATMEQDGFIWVYTVANVDPSCHPFAVPALAPGATEVRRVLEAV